MEKIPKIKDEKRKPTEAVEAPAEVQVAQDEDEMFLENSIYEGIFCIFEDELAEIGRYVAFTKRNMNTYSNKIHELHLRVCSEIENVLKVVVHNHFVPKSEVDSLWEEAKSEKLKEKSLTDKYNELKESLIADENSKRKKREAVKLDLNLFGFPDFLFYFKIACEKFNLHKKVIKFTGMVSHSIDWEVIQPFELVDGREIPIWWSNYNKLKHDKIKNFDVCTLDDLIHSMSGLYILMNYLLKYQVDNNLYENQNFSVGKTINIGCDFCSFKAIFFVASNASQDPLFSIVLPNDITESDFENRTIQELQFKRFSKFAKFEHIKIKDFNFKSDEYSYFNLSKRVINNKLDLLNNYENALFYIYLDYEQCGDWNGGYFRRRRQLGIFIN